jgi:hypothetical protein
MQRLCGITAHRRDSAAKSADSRVSTLRHIPRRRESTCIVKDLRAIAGRSRIGTRFALSRVTIKSKRREGARQ